MSVLGVWVGKGLLGEEPWGILAWFGPGTWVFYGCSISRYCSRVCWLTRWYPKLICGWKLPVNYIHLAYCSLFNDAEVFLEVSSPLLALNRGACHLQFALRHTLSKWLTFVQTCKKCFLQRRWRAIMFLLWIVTTIHKLFMLNQYLLLVVSKNIRLKWKPDYRIVCL